MGTTCIIILWVNGRDAYSVRKSSNMLTLDRNRACNAG